jgi:predicted dehydrogenase
MINVGITGSLSAIDRHTDALSKITNIRISGRWISSGSQDTATEPDTGIVCHEPATIIDKSDALIITDEGAFCSRLAVAGLRKAKHVFLYPSMVRSQNEAYQLMKLAREATVILKCGRTCKTGISGLLKAIHEAGTISMIELQHYLNIANAVRPADISDVLVGDAEIINSLVPARNTSIKAKGLCMLSSMPEIINARLEFDNGCAVNYNCNLVAAQNEYLITLVIKNRILKYNLLTDELTGWTIHHTNNINESPIFIENIRMERTDSLQGELTEFVQQICSGPAFLSLQDNGFESVILTERILEKVMKTLIQCA